MRGFRKKPWWIYALAAGYASAPGLCLLQLAQQVGFDPALLAEILRSSFFWVEAGVGLFCMLGVLWVTRPTFLAVVTLSAISIFQKLSNLASGHLFDTGFELTLLLLWSGLTLGLLFTTLRTPYLNPKLRWWKQQERYRALAHGVLRQGDLVFPVITLNLSRTGIFLKLDERALQSVDSPKRDANLPSADRRKHHPAGQLALGRDELTTARDTLDHYPRRLGSHVHLTLHSSLPAPLDASFESEAEVVWSAPLDSHYRFGLGLRFSGQSAAQRRQLKAQLRALEETRQAAR